MQSGYLLRLKIRRAREARRRQVGLGLIGGWLLLLLGAFKWLYVANSSQGAACAFMVAGSSFLAAGLLGPSLLRPVESTLRTAGNWIGHGIFSGLLTVTYFCVITPVGLAMRVGAGPGAILFRKGVRPKAGRRKSSTTDRSGPERAATTGRCCCSRWLYSLISYGCGALC